MEGGGEAKGLSALGRVVAPASAQIPSRRGASPRNADRAAVKAGGALPRASPRATIQMLPDHTRHSFLMCVFQCVYVYCILCCCVCVAVFCYMFDAC